MKQFLFLALIILSSVSFGQSTNAVEQVKLADIALNELIIKKNSNAAADFYATDFVLTTSSGRQKRKQEILSEINSALLSMEINLTENVEVITTGNTAVLTGILHQKGIYDGRPFDVKLRVTDTWVKIDTGWKILAGHASLLSKT